jgi:hypothetical protein
MDKKPGQQDPDMRKLIMGEITPFISYIQSTHCKPHDSTLILPYHNWVFCV